MRLGYWLLVMGVGLTATSACQAQLFHKQRCQPCCPAESWAPAAEPPLTTPKGEPIPAPKGVDVPTMVEPSFPPESDIGMDLGGGELSTFDSAVGYIDNAIPSNLFRLRFDAAWRSNRPTRAEYFYARSGPLGPGLPRAESNVDYQELTAYAEGKLADQLSVFIETPVRFLNPTINENHEGFGDMNFGFKYAFLFCPDRVASFQFRTWVPTGDAHDGLGTDHVSLEPSLLYYRKLSDVLRMEAELRYWIPIGGTNFAGDIVRYGIGFSYGERPADEIWLTPVLEVVGWTVLDGLEAAPPPIPPPIVDASGDTIINVKLGLRLGFGNVADVYTGYGRPLTGEVWYKDIWRTELRIAF